MVGEERDWHDCRGDFVGRRGLHILFFHVQRLPRLLATIFVRVNCI